MLRKKSLFVGLRIALFINVLVFSIGLHDGTAWASQSANRPAFIDLEAFSSNEVSVTAGDRVTILVTAVYNGGAGDAIPCGQLNLGVVNDEDAQFRDDAAAPGAWEQHGWRSSNRVAASNCIGSAGVGTRVYWAVNLFVPVETATGKHAVGTFSPIHEGTAWSDSQIDLSVDVSSGSDTVEAQPDSNGRPVFSGLEAVAGDTTKVTAGGRTTVVVTGIYDGGRGAIPCDKLNLGVVEDADASFRDDTGAPGAWEQHGWRAANRVAAFGCEGEVQPGQQIQWNVTLYVSSETEPGTYLVGNFSPVYDDVDNGWAESQISLFVAVSAPATTPDVAASPAPPPAEAALTASTPVASVAVTPEETIQPPADAATEPSTPSTPEPTEVVPTEDPVTQETAATEPSAPVATEAVPTEEPVTQEPPTMEATVEETIAPTAEETVTDPQAEATETAEEETPAIETVEPAMDPTAEPDVTGSSLPAEFAGTWEGDVVQVNPSFEFPVTITFTGGGVDEVVATIEYPTYECGGEVTLQRVDPGSVQLEENITFGEENCIDGGAMTLTIDPDGSMDFSWNSPDGVTTAGATLVQVSGASRESTSEPTEEDATTQPPIATVDDDDTTEEPPSATEPAGTTLPAGFSGAWEGVGIQTNPDVEWPITITFTGGAVGDEVATTAYPTYDCTGVLVLESVDQDVLTTTERITGGDCADNGAITLTLLPDGRMAFAWSGAGDDSTAMATLENADGVTDAPDEPTTEATEETIAPLPTETATVDDGISPSGQSPTAEPEDKPVVEPVGGNSPAGETAGVPGGIEDLLPTDGEIPNGLVLATDDERTLEELSAALSGDPDETAALLEGWGWQANVYQEFGTAGAQLDPAMTSSVTVSVHQFDDADGAIQSFDYFVSDAATAFDFDEIPVETASGASPLGDNVRAMGGRSNDQNVVLIYVQIDSYVIRVGGASPEGDPMADVEAMARSILRRATQLQPAGVALVEEQADVGSVTGDVSADEAAMIQPAGGAEEVQPIGQPTTSADLEPTDPTSDAPDVIGSDNPDADDASRAAIEISRLEAARDFDGLYDLMHPDAQALIPREAVVGWYGDYLATRDAEELTIVDVQFVDWTWGVTGERYPNTAEIAYEQPFSDGSLDEDTIRLVESNGEWRWFFGRNAEFVNDQIETYAPDAPPIGSNGTRSRTMLLSPGTRYSSTAWGYRSAIVPSAGIQGFNNR